MLMPLLPAVAERLAAQLEQHALVGRLPEFCRQRLTHRYGFPRVVVGTIGGIIGLAGRATTRPAGSAAVTAG